MDIRNAVEKRIINLSSLLILSVGMLNITTAYAGFFDVCLQSPPGTINVTKNTTVVNESVSLPDAPCCSPTTCQISVDDGVKLEFINVRVRAIAGNVRLAFDGGENSQLKIRLSKLSVCDNDIYGFSGGVTITHSLLQDPPGDRCDLMEIEPDGDLTIEASELSTIYTMQLNSPGSVKIEGSKIYAKNKTYTGEINIGTDYDNSIVSRAVFVKASKLVSGGNIVIGADQEAKVLLNQLSAKGAVNLIGNPCQAMLNIPSVSCQ